MTIEDNKAIVRGYMTESDDPAFQRGKYFSENVVFNGTSTLDQLMARQLMMRAAFTCHRRIINDQIAEGDKVATRVTFEGVHTGVFNGVAPTGKAVEYRGVAVDRIENGKVVEMWHMTDTMALMHQIGASFSAVTKS
jgi:predicted ester cyclase